MICWFQVVHHYHRLMRALCNGLGWLCIELAFRTNWFSRFYRLGNWFYDQADYHEEWLLD